MGEFPYLWSVACACAPAASSRCWLLAFPTQTTHFFIGLWRLTVVRNVQRRFTMLAANFTLPWWRQTTVADYQAFIVACQGQRDHPCMREFAEQHAVVNVFVSNKMEGTLPSGSEDLDTYDLVKKEMGLTGKDYLPQTPVTWHAEGSVEGNTDKRQSAKAQLTQHARALRYLAEQQQLTATSLKEAHKILVHGAQEGGAPTLAGAYRQTPAHSGTRFEYPAPRFIEAMVEEVLSSFHSNLERARAGNLDTNTMAAKLFYDMVTLHPFENGNGRLCRLLVSYALRAAGEPFLLCMSNGQGRSQQHYHQVLRWADQHNGNTTRLAAYILKCHHFVWQSFSRSLESNEQDRHVQFGELLRMYGLEELATSWSGACVDDGRTLTGTSCCVPCAQA